MVVRGRRATDDGRRAARDEVLVRVGDLAGRPRGTGFVADHHGTVVTSHEAVDGLARIVVHATGDRVCVVTSDAVTPLPALDLALIRTQGLCVDPLPFALRDEVETGAYVRIAAGGWREARVLGTADVTYTATDGFHLLRGALELAIGTAGSEALRLGGGAAGGPVLDMTTGAVLGVLGTALEAQHRATGFAVPLRGWRAEQPLAELLARNAATVPAYGTDLNLAGVLELTATTVGSDGPGAGAGAVAAAGADPVERVDVVREFTAFAEGPATVLGLVGPPGSGRTTELAALAARRGRGSAPAPTLWLRGADLLSADTSVADAARRALERAGRIVAASASASAASVASAAGSGAGSSGEWGASPDPGDAGGWGGSGRAGRAAGSADARWATGTDGPPGSVGTAGGGVEDGFAASGGWAASDFSAAFAASAGAHGGEGSSAGVAGEGAAGVERPCLPGRYQGELGDIRPERLARLAGAEGRPLLLLLDGPEEMPPTLAHRLAEWTAGTVEWLRANGARLVVACRAEYWERAGAHFPAELLHGEAPGAQEQLLPACVRLGDLTESEARRARLRYGIPEDALTAADARHPLTLRLLSEIRAALPTPSHGGPDEDAASAGPPDEHLTGTAARTTGPDEEPEPRVQADGLGPDTQDPTDSAYHRLRPPRSAAEPPQPKHPTTTAYTSGPAAHASDPAPHASGSAAHAAGCAAHASGSTHTSGCAAHASGPTPHASGSAAHASGPTPHASGSAAHASGAAAHAAGSAAHASGPTPHAPGPATPASGPTPHPSGAPTSPPTSSARPGRDDVLGGYLDLMCLRVAVRLAAVNGVRGAAVRRLAAQVSGQVHEAARRCLGPGQGELDRAAFEAVFPWGPVPGRRLGGTTGWASAVLTEGLLVPAGDGYRFAHEELADWIQGAHLDLDAALHALVHHGWVAQAESRRGWGTMPSEARVRRQARRATRNLPVPRHRIGPVVHALLLLGRQQGPTELAGRLEELLDALDALLPPGTPAPDDPTWWATRLLAEVLLRVPDATPYTRVLRFLTERIGAWRAQGRGVPAEFGPDFWASLPLPEAERFDLLRRLVVADPATGEGPRYLDAVSRLLAADPAAVQPLLTRWFPDDTPLVATPDATVATAAQALLHTHRRSALDELTEALVDSAHRRGDELLAVLSEEEPSAVCRAVDRWAHDDRPARRVAGLAYALRTAPHVRTDADRELLRYAALALLGRPADVTLHSGALALLVRDPLTRQRYLPQALERFAAGDPQLPASAVVTALATDPDPVLDAFRARLRTPGAEGSDGEALRTLAEVTTPGLARRVTTLVREVVAQRPEVAGHVAVYVDRRLEHGPGTRAVLFPLVSGLIVDGPVQVRAALAAVFAEPGTPVSGPLRRELLDLLMATERDPSVLDALLRAVVAGTTDRAGSSEGEGAGGGRGAAVRVLVHRIGLLLVRTPEGATRFDWALVDLARHVPGFAELVAGWLNGTPQEWAAVVGPSTRRMIENLAGLPGVRVPA
ncbi:trypsin-like peptidase domain-containing protein [Streptomyces deccanensis]|uniref:trypsin-like peptidase domain-containing protein n=1 Tax=Streptomyces deccanensis TaxID=424188 RepID=UPI001EFB1CBE|nr:trypsin-like peptidase domain-containing protein [Streptomyces deccanensis]ULR53709.1 serine protease [Streptomyces deccanensis]